ncbi:MAG: inorganic diphosphatase [Pyrinomonadaceae bacterium]
MAAKPSPLKGLAELSAEASDAENVHVVIDTPKGSRNKYKLEEKLGVFMLGGVLPAGAVFPFDFGFVPSTEGGDGDPLDVLVLMDEPAFVGCVIEARLVGVIEAEQTDDEGTNRNDRLIAVAAKSRNHRDVRSLGQLSHNLVAEIEHFFVSYNQMKGKRFEPLGRGGPERAAEIVEEGVKLFRRKHTRRHTPAKVGGAKKGRGG